MVMVRNLLVCREPLYAVRAWAAKFEPSLLSLSPQEVPLLNDDRVGRSLVRIPTKRASVPGIKSHPLSPRLRWLRECRGGFFQSSWTSFPQGAVAPSRGCPHVPEGGHWAPATRALVVNPRRAPRWPVGRSTSPANRWNPLEHCGRADSSVCPRAVFSGGIQVPPPLRKTHWWPTTRELGGLDEPGKPPEARLGLGAGEDVDCVNNSLCVTPRRPPAPCSAVRRAFLPTLPSARCGGRSARCGRRSRRRSWVLRSPRAIWRRATGRR